ncbi:PH domain-containing protein [Leucobacter ruminantium]|uniref:PH domain-containing protein n=1 Tax=Leucobacter ruminantium TaxID=1289170 RepID=A0A939RYG0_9MICO|nr:PH domain-containing protein [Leucobacter ruminantium]
MLGIAEGSLPGTADAEGWRRLHPLSPLLRGGLVLLVIVGVVVANFRDRFVELFFADRVFEGSGVDVDVDPSGDIVSLIEYLAGQGLLLLVLGALLAVLLLIVLFAWIAWRFSTYRITDEAVEARRGVLFRTHRRAPLERIQSVNLQRSLPARVLGLTKIEVLTAGQGGKVELAYLGYRDAKTVREQIVRRAAMKRGGRPAVAAALPQAAAGIAGRGVLANVGDRLSERAIDFADADIDPEAIAADALVRVPVGRLLGGIALGWEAVVTLVLMVAVIVGGSLIAPGVLFGIVPLILVMASILFTQFNKGFNFTLSRDGDSVRTGAGLTATATETIPFGRIHAVEARQPLLWRPLGWWRVRITVAGHSVAQGGQNTSQNVVLPVGPEADVLRVIETLLPGVGDDEHEMAALRDGLMGSGEGYLRAGPRAAWVLLWGRRRAGIRIADEGTAQATLRVRRGVLTRSLAIMPIVRAQSVQLRRPLLHRLLGLASLQAHTVLGPVRMEMRGIELEAARSAFDELAAEVLRVQGTEARELREEIRERTAEGSGEGSAEGSGEGSAKGPWEATPPGDDGEETR